MRASLATVPSCSASMQAGRAVADCVFHRDRAAASPTSSTCPSARSSTALGTSWSALRELDDLDVWVEAAENVLGLARATAPHVGAFYEVGYQLSTLINLAHLAGETRGAR